MPTLSRRAILILLAISLSTLTNAANDTWSNVPSASDDRFTNPKSALYAGPNGWYNFGELRSLLGDKPTYSYKGGLNSTSDMLVLVGQQPLHVLSLDFGVDPDEQTLAPGTYTASAAADYAKREVKVGFGDTTGGKILSWDSQSNAGSITVTHVEGFVYVYARKLTLVPSMVYNKGENDQPLVVGFEGAVKQ